LGGNERVEPVGQEKMVQSGTTFKDGRKKPDKAGQRKKSESANVNAHQLTSLRENWGRHLPRREQWKKCGSHNGMEGGGLNKVAGDREKNRPCISVEEKSRRRPGLPEKSRGIQLGGYRKWS